MKHETVALKPLSSAILVLHFACHWKSAFLIPNSAQYYLQFTSEDTILFSDQQAKVEMLDILLNAARRNFPSLHSTTEVAPGIWTGCLPSWAAADNREFAAEGDAVAGADKMSVAFAIEHRPGTLVAALERLARAGVDLTKIESRPVPGSPWEYVFYVDVRFSDATQAEAALAALQEHCRMVKVLGRYRAA